jgi:hypothetical protein
MKNHHTYQITIVALILLPLVLMAWKMNQGYLSNQQFSAENQYEVKMNFMTKGGKEQLFIKSYIPQSNTHQKILNVGVFSQGLDFQILNEDGGLIGEWNKSQVSNNHQVSYAFQYKGNEMKYHIDKKIPIDISTLPDSLNTYIEASEHIQSDHLEIIQLVKILTSENDKLLDATQKIYNYTVSITKNSTNELTDALTTLHQQEASCNGKSRLFVALCRAKGIPARVAGGIILQQGKKRTSHLWSEIWVQGNWIPFDTLNEHFASLPANYLELYKGDYFLISRSTDIEFNYLFDIQREEIFTQKTTSALTLWALPIQAEIPMGLLKVILLLPLCSLMIALFRNVIGMKTFGVFLPAIITVAIDGLGVGFGVMMYLSVVAVVGLLHYPLTKWGLLHTPKLVIMLVGVVSTLLGLTYLGVVYQSISLSSVIFFPIIILSIAAEKFAKVIMEEGIQDALKIQAQTLIVVLLCYGVYHVDFLTGFFLTFPETLAIIVSIMLLLGRWIGLRLSEYRRFSWIVS